MTNKLLSTLLAESGIRQVELARKCGVNKSTASRWLSRGIPPLRVLEVEKATGISREKLRPDLYEIVSGAPR